MIRRILKKTAAVAVVSMMVCSMFTGCGKNGETKDTGVKTVRAGAMPYYFAVQFMSSFNYKRLLFERAVTGYQG